jgi:putative oxidoreductase
MIIDKTQALIGRLLIALLFILAGIAKIFGPQPFIAHMNEFGVPAVLLPLVIALEVGAGLAIAFGWRVRETATALGFFCLLTALIFHHDLQDKAERSTFFKDIAIAGGLLSLAANSTLARRSREQNSSGLQVPDVDAAA